MSTVATYPSYSSLPAHVDADRLRSVLQRQQHEQAVSAPVPAFNYLIDVPVSEGDVARWDAVFSDTQARTQAALRARAKGASAHVGAATAEEEEGEAEGRDGDVSDTPDDIPSYFLNADAMLNYIPTDADRKARTYAKLSPFPAFDPAAVATLPMTKALKVRREWLPHRNQFPLYQQRARLMDAVLRRDFVAVVGPTGSGRTLQTPIILSESEAMRRRRIVLVSATATAARLTAVRLRIERGEDAATSRSVAAVLPLHNEATPGTVILTTTAEVLLRQLLADPLLLDVGCVIFDDAHVRSAEAEVCLALLRERIVLHRMYEGDRQRRAGAGGGAGGGGAAEAAGAASASNMTTTAGSQPAAVHVRPLTVIANCPDEAAAAPLVDFFKSPVPTTTTSLFISDHGGDTAASTLPPCTTETVVLEGAGGSGGAGGGGGSLDAGAMAALSATPLLRGGNQPVFYLEELVQWLHKCRREGRSTLCAEPETELQPFVESVDVVTRVMESAEADFANADKCRSYWCALIAEAILYYGTAICEARADVGGTPTVLVVAPNVTSARLIHSVLRTSLDGTAAAENEEGSASAGRPTFRMTLLDENRSPFADFLAVAERSATATTAGEVRVLLTTPELAQTVLPPTVAVGLLLDCARVSHRTFDVTAACDQVVTEYASTQALRYRRGIAASAKGVSCEPDSPSAAAASLTAPPIPLTARFMTVQLIPKSLLHSVQHRRASADPLQQHPVFRLSLERYLRLYQVFQARDEAAAYARHLAVKAGAASSYLTASTVSSRAPQLLTTTFIGVPPASSGARYEHMRRVLTLVENYLVAAGHVDVNTTVAGELFTSMKPLGVLATLLAGPLPTSVARLMVLCALFACPLEGTAVAATWLVGDAFNSSIAAALAEAAVEGPARSTEELADDEGALRALTKEARLFFSRDSLSDVVSGYNVYRMWLSMRAPAATVAADATSGGACGGEPEMSEDERAFLDECRVPRRLLLRIESTQRALYDLLIRSGLTASDAATASNPADTLAARLLALPEESILESKVQACLTGALYPNCAAIEDARDAKLSAMVLMDSLHVVSAARASATGATVTAKRLGVFGENSVVSDPETAARLTGRPFLFLDKTVGASAAGTSAAHVYVMEQAAPLQLAAAVVFCGEGHMRQKEVPKRCRGWTPCTSTAWRHTRRARTLPPPAQLPTPSIALAAYDTVGAESMIISTDDNCRLTMRSTTSTWLLRVRRHIQAQLQSFLWGDQHRSPVVGSSSSSDAEPVTAAAMFGDVAEAWSWWARRQRDGAAWLRESRRSRASEHRGEDGGAEVPSVRPNLFGFYCFRTEAGAPEKVVVPAPGVARADGGASASGGAQAGGAATDTAAAGGPVAGAVDAAPPAATAAPARKHYTGKRPRDDMDQVIRMCVEGVAQRRTREHEAVLLHDDPVTFGFLNPDNEFHEYYLYRLQEAAPNLEVLGDSIEELIKYLENLETELRKELGHPEPAAAGAGGEGHTRDTHGTAAGRAGLGGAGGASADTATGAAAAHRPQLRDVVADATGVDGDGMGEGLMVGLQMETDASVRVKRQTGLNFAARRPPSSTEAAPVRSVAKEGAPSAGTAAGTAGVPAFMPAAPEAAMSGQQTLLQKLMAMKNASGGATGPPEAEQPPSAAPAVGATVAAAASATAPLVATVNPLGSLPAPAPAPAFTPPASTADLLALLMRTAPAAAAQRDGGSTATGAGAGSEGTAATGGESMIPAVSTPAPTGLTPAGPAAPVSAPAPAPSTAELLALLGMAPRTQTADSAATHPAPPPPLLQQQQQQQYQQQPQQPALMVSPPSTADLLSVLGITPRGAGYPGGPPMSTAGGVGGLPIPPGAPAYPMYVQPPPGLHSATPRQQQQQQPSTAPHPRSVNPLTRPPPPLPAKVVEESAASVLVYPIPENREGGNMHLALARALGAALDMMVGPTRIVGRVARIMVANSKVAARAIALGKFRCLGTKVYVFKNDRIVDNPDRPLDDARHPGGGGGRVRSVGGGGRGRPAGAAVPGSRPPPSPPAPGQGGEEGREGGANDGGGGDGPGEEEEDPTSMGFSAQQATLPVGIAVGALSDSDSDGGAS